MLEMTVSGWVVVGLMVALFCYGLFLLLRASRVLKADSRRWTLDQRNTVFDEWSARRSSSSRPLTETDYAELRALAHARLGVGDAALRYLIGSFTMLGLVGTLMGMSESFRMYHHAMTAVQDGLGELSAPTGSETAAGSDEAAVGGGIGAATILKDVAVMQGRSLSGMSTAMSASILGLLFTLLLGGGYARLERRRDEYIRMLEREFRKVAGVPGSPDHPASLSNADLVEAVKRVASLLEAAPAALSASVSAGVSSGLKTLESAVAKAVAHGITTAGDEVRARVAAASESLRQEVTSTREVGDEVRKTTSMMAQSSSLLSRAASDLAAATPVLGAVAEAFKEAQRAATGVAEQTATARDSFRDELEIAIGAGRRTESAIKALAVAVEASIGRVAESMTRLVGALERIESSAGEASAESARQISDACKPLSDHVARLAEMTASLAVTTNALRGATNTLEHAAGRRASEADAAMTVVREALEAVRSAAVQVSHARAEQALAQQTLVRKRGIFDFWFRGRP